MVGSGTTHMHGDNLSVAVGLGEDKQHDAIEHLLDWCLCTPPEQAPLIKRCVVSAQITDDYDPLFRGLLRQTVQWHTN